MFEIVFSAAFFMVLVSLVNTVLIFLTMDFTQQINGEEATKGESVAYTITIRNRSFFHFPYLILHFFEPAAYLGREYKALRIFLKPFSKQTIDLNIPCKYRGKFRIGTDYIEIMDYLGLFRFQYRVKKEFFITVFPRIVVLDKLPIAATASLWHQSAAGGFGTTTDFSDIRDYNYGDSLKTVHWKQSARLDQLMVKDYEKSSLRGGKVYCFLDLAIRLEKDQDPRMIEDKIIECLIAVIDYCMYKGIPATLAYYRDGLVEKALLNQWAYDEFYKIAATIEFQWQIGVREFLSTSLNMSEDTDTFLILTANFNHQFLDEINKWKASQHSHFALYIFNITALPKEKPEATLKSLVYPNMHVYEISVNDDTKFTLEM